MQSEQTLCFDCIILFYWARYFRIKDILFQKIIREIVDVEKSECNIIQQKYLKSMHWSQRIFENSKIKFKEFCKGIRENKLLRIWLHIVHPFFLVIKLMPYASYPPPQQCKQCGEIISYNVAYLFLCPCIFLILMLSENWNRIIGLTTNKYLVSSTHYSI